MEELKEWIKERIKQPITTDFDVGWKCAMTETLRRMNQVKEERRAVLVDLDGVEYEPCPDLNKHVKVFQDILMNCTKCKELKPKRKKK